MGVVSPWCTHLSWSTRQCSVALASLLSADPGMWTSMSTTLLLARLRRSLQRMCLASLLGLALDLVTSLLCLIRLLATLNPVSSVPLCLSKLSTVVLLSG